jgi:RNA polymerase sigma-70 factor, ECF subfamily
MTMSTGAARRLEPAGPRTDEELVDEVRAGCGAAFEELVRRHRAHLRRVVRGVLRDRNEVDDAVQQALLQAFTGLDGFASTAPFSAWLTRIAVNEALMRSRRRRRLELAAPQLVHDSGGPTGNPEQEAASREAMDRVRAAFPRLPAQHREVIQLTTLHELSRADVAELLGVSEGAVKVRLHRAREALRGLLAREDRPRRRATPRLVVAPARTGVNGSSQQEDSLRVGRAGRRYPAEGDEAADWARAS